MQNEHELDEVMGNAGSHGEEQATLDMRSGSQQLGKGGVDSVQEPSIAK